MEHHREFNPIDTVPACKARPEPSFASSGETLQALSNSSAKTILLDFDGTLFLDNSTERFLDSVRPRIIAFLFVLLADTTARLMAKTGLFRYEVWRDHLRVLACCLFLPWSLPLWRRSSAVRMRPRLNHALIDAVPDQARLIIVSYGFRTILEPLLEAFPRPHTLVCSRLWPFHKNLRCRGKISALRQTISPLVWEDAFFVTDSLDDHELLEQIPQSCLVEWKPRAPKAFHNLYVPLRYTLEGKYPNRHYWLNQILMEDFLILLLMFPFDLGIWLTLPGLFLSLHAIYEIGYYENDFHAAPREKKPCVSASFASFAGYPIYHAWYWAIPLAGIGFLLRLIFDTAGMGDIAIPFSLWTALLAVLYGVFQLFNRLSISNRIWVFPLLHLIKNGAFALCYPLTPLGIALLAAQVLSQTAHYTVYRRTGTTDHFNRHTVRLTLFLGISAVAGVLHLFSYQQLFSFPMAIILAWCIIRAVERRYRMNFFMMVLRILRGKGRFAPLQ